MKFSNIVNRKALHDFSLVEKYSAGMCLKSDDVKNIVNGHFQIAGSYVKIIKNEIYLVGQNQLVKLLMQKREINRLIGKVDIGGNSIVPLSIFRSDGGKFKLEIALVKGKKEYDKREADKKRTIENENRRIVKSQKFDS